MQTAKQIMRQTLTVWKEKHASSLAAALAFYTIFALLPLLLLSFLLLSQSVANEGFSQQFQETIASVIGTQGTDALFAVMRQYQLSSSHVLGWVLGLLGLIIAAGGVFGELETAVNRIWDTPIPSDQTLWQRIHREIIPFSLIVVFAALLAVTMISSTLLHLFSELIPLWFPVLQQAVYLLDTVLFFVIVTLATACIYRILPRQTVPWKEIWVGALVTALMLTIGKVLLGFYFSSAQPTSGFGALSSILIVLLWVYYSAQLFFLGAAFTHVYAKAQVLPDATSPHPETSSSQPHQLTSLSMNTKQKTTIRLLERVAFVAGALLAIIKYTRFLWRVIRKLVQLSKRFR